MNKPPNDLKWFVVAMLAGWWLALRCHWKVFFIRGWQFIRLWVSYMRTRPTVESIALADARNESCRKCPMHDSRWETCGFLGEVYFDHEQKMNVPFGCWCYTPAANLIPGKDCWARAHDYEIGWHNEIRPKDIRPGEIRPTGWRAVAD